MSGDGAVVAVGAHGNDVGGVSAGQVRAFLWDSGSGTGGAWVQRGADLYGGEPDSHGDYFGRAVAMNEYGTMLAIGSPGRDLPGTASIGQVNVYRWDGNSWVQRGPDIHGEGSSDQSGYSVSMSSDGNIVAIGAWGNSNDVSGANAGHVRVYTWESASSTWLQRGVDIDGEASKDYSGFSIDLSDDGSLVAIGAYANDGTATGAGHVRVYKWDGVAWNQRGTDIDGEAEADASGRALAISGDGNILAVGAYKNSGLANGAGHTRVYAWDSGSGASGAWVQRGVDIDGEAENDRFGWSMALSSDGAVLAVGATHHDTEAGNNAGHVRIFDWDSASGAWVQRGVDIGGESAGDYSGYAVALSSDGATVAIGAYGNDDAGSGAGQVRVYHYGI